MTADVPPERNGGPSILELALRVVLGEITREEALRILQSSPAAEGEQRQDVRLHSGRSAEGVQEPGDARRAEPQLLVDRPVHLAHPQQVVLDEGRGIRSRRDGRSARRNRHGEGLGRIDDGRTECTQRLFGTP